MNVENGSGTNEALHKSDLPDISSMAIKGQAPAPVAPFIHSIGMDIDHTLFS